MASSCQKPSSLVFDSDIAEQWRMFELDYAHYICIIHWNDPDDLKISLLLNLAGPEAVIRAANFEFIPALNDANGQVFVPAESIDNPTVLLRKFRELCDCPRTASSREHGSSPDSSRSINPSNASSVIYDT